jgi:coenzyme F420-reducing hydrogenase gamma subunit
MDWASGIDMYIPVDYYVYGCGPNPKHIVEVIVAAIQGREPKLPRYSVCVECKSKGNVCVLVAGGMNCMGPVTVAGCEAACPSRNRGCYSCFGPMPQANVNAYGQLLELLSHDNDQIVRSFRKMSSNSDPFKEVAKHYAS